MKSIKLLPLALFFGSASLLFSCKKDKTTTPDGNTPATCQVVNMVDSSEIGFKITYSGMNPVKLSEWDRVDATTWEEAPLFALRYNDNGSLRDFMIIESSPITLERAKYNANGRIAEVMAYDSIIGMPPAYSHSIFPKYDANGLITRLAYADQSGDTSMVRTIEYDTRKHVGAVTSYTVDAGNYVPDTKLVFISDDQAQNSFLFSVLFSGSEEAYLWFNQAGQGQSRGFVEYTYNKSSDTWEQTDDLPVLNYYDANNRVTRSKVDTYLLDYSYDCK